MGALELRLEAELARRPRSLRGLRPKLSPVELIAAARAGDRGALARLITLVESGGESARDVDRAVFALGGAGYTVGVTGPPGSGKSTLSDCLIRELRSADEEVAVLCVDPSSPFTGGAFLGDRVRMQDHALDPGVFVRSMASRGHLGGLALATPQAVRVLDAAGLPWILVETVGVGQVELEVAGAADTTLVVLNPGAGDDIQANKAGLIEVADIFVINRSDRPGADQLRRELQFALELSPAREWHPPLVSTVATEGTGVAELLSEIRRHRAHLESTGELAERRGRRLSEELREVVARRLLAQAEELIGDAGHEQLRADLADRRIDPYTAAEKVLGASVVGESPR